MSLPEVVPIENLRDYVARTMVELNAGVDLARSQNIPAELPREVQFTMTVIAPDGWQALSATSEESATTREDGASTETGANKETTTANDTGKNTEKQGGFQTEDSSTTSEDKQSGKETRTTNGEDHHTQNTDETVSYY